MKTNENSQNNAFAKCMFFQDERIAPDCSLTKSDQERFALLALCQKAIGEQITLSLLEKEGKSKNRANRSFAPFLLLFRSFRSESLLF